MNYYVLDVLEVGKPLKSTKRCRFRRELRRPPITLFSSVSNRSPESPPNPIITSRSAVDVLRNGTGRWAWARGVLSEGFQHKRRSVGARYGPETGLQSSTRTALTSSEKSANFEKIDVLDVLDVTNPQKSRKKCRSVSTRAPETFRNPVFQHFRVLSEEPPGPGHH